MRGNYLIPANSKKSLKIFGLFYPIDLIIFGTGVFLTLIFMVTFPLANLTFAITAILPATITGLLVFPVPYYHNVLTVIGSTWQFFTTRQKFIWKGWCVTNEKESNQK